MKTSFPKDKIRCLLLEDVNQTASKRMNQFGYSAIECMPHSLSETDLIQKINSDNIRLLGIRSKTQINKRLFEDCPKLMAIGCFCIGTNQVDLEAANEHGVAVFNAPFSNTRSVAELVIAAAILLKRRVVEKNTLAHQGIWSKQSKGCNELRGKTIGIVGYGHIGSQLSVLSEALGMRVVFYDIEPKLPLGNALSVNNLRTLLEDSDVVSLHVPETDLTKNMITEKELGWMKPNSVLINYSRGTVVDIDALANHLKKDKIAGAAVDVFPVEPKANNDESFETQLQNIPNVLLSPHIGGSTEEAQQNIGIDVASKLLNFIDTGSSIGSHSIPELSLPLQENVHRILHVHRNRPGVLSTINELLTKNGQNIIGQHLKTNKEVGYVVLDVQNKLNDLVIEELKAIGGTIRLRMLF